MKYNTALIFLFTLKSVFGQINVVLPVQYDAAIGYHDNFNTQFNNYSSAEYNGAYCIPGSSGGLNVNRALIKFDLNQIPECAEIVDARLDLYAAGAIGTLTGHTIGNNEAQLSRITESWNINSVNWMNQPASTTENAVFLSASSSQVQDYLNIDVTQLVIDMQQQGDRGFLLKQTTESPNRVMVFRSGDYSDVSKHPQLRISYLNCDSLNTVPSDPPVYSYSVPNVFTPNDDAANDVFSLNVSNAKEISLTILNRWGNEVFSSTGSNPEWTGISDGTICKEGVYFVIYSITFQDDHTVSGHSFVHLEH